MLQRLFTYIDAMPLLDLVTAWVLILAVAWLVWTVSIIRRTKVDPDWSKQRDAQGRVFGVVKRQGHDEYELPPAKTLEGRVMPTRRLRPR